MRIRVRFKERKFWLLFSPEQTVLSFIETLRGHVGVSTGTLKLYVQDFEIPHNLTCEVLSQDDIVEIQHTPEDDEESYASLAIDLPALKRRKLSEATTALAQIELDRTVPTYKAALPSVQPAAHIEPLSRADLAHFLTEPIAGSEEDDDDFDMDGVESSSDDSMSEDEDTPPPHIAVAAAAASPPPAPVQRPISPGPQITMNANGSPVYQPQSPKIRVPTPPPAVERIAVPAHVSSASSSSISSQEDAPDYIGDLLKNSVEAYKAELQPGAQPGLASPTLNVPEAAVSSTSTPAKQSGSKPSALAKATSSSSGSDSSSSSSSSSSDSSSSSSSSSSSDSSSEEDSSEDSTPSIQVSAKATVDGVDGTAMELPMLYHPDITKPEFHWVSKAVGYPASRFPQLATATQPTGVLLSHVPSAHKVQAWIKGKRQPEVLEYLKQLDNQQGTQHHTKKSLPFQGFKATKSRNARRRKKAAAERRALLGVAPTRPNAAPRPTQGQSNVMSDIKEMSKLQDQISGAGLLEAEKRAALAKLEALQASIMTAIDAREEHQSAPQPKQNRKKAQQPRQAEPAKAVFPSLASKSQVSGLFNYPSTRKDVPSNITVSSIDMEATDFVPGVAQPDFNPVRNRYRHNNGMPSKFNGKDQNGGQADQWAGWLDVDQVARKFPLLARATEPSMFQKGDRIAFQLLELSQETYAPEYATYHGVLTADPSIQVGVDSSMITTSTGQAPPEKEECSLSIKLHPSSIRPTFDDQGNEQLVEEVSVGWDEIVDVRRLPAHAA